MKNLLFLSCALMVQLQASEAAAEAAQFAQVQDDGSGSLVLLDEPLRTKHPHPHHHLKNEKTDSGDQLRDGFIRRDDSGVLGSSSVVSIHQGLRSQQEEQQLGNDTLAEQLAEDTGFPEIMIPTESYAFDENGNGYNRRVLKASEIRRLINNSRDAEFTYRLSKIVEIFGVSRTVREESVDDMRLSFVQKIVGKASDLLHNLSDWLVWNPKPIVTYDRTNEKIEMMSLYGDRFTVPIDFLAAGPEVLQNQVFELYMKVKVSKRNEYEVSRRGRIYKKVNQILEDEFDGIQKRV